MTEYKETAYLNLTDSSSLAMLSATGDEYKIVYAVGYQGDDVLHLIDDTTAETLEAEAGADWTEIEECEQEIVVAV